MRLCGCFELRYLRDKQKREVEFLVGKDQRPWFLGKVGAGDSRLSPTLRHFQEQTGAPHAFHAVLALPYEPVDCFDCFATGRSVPVVVPARTLLSQLL